LTIHKKKYKLFQSKMKCEKWIKIHFISEILNLN
jgi:hypothetical protein